MDRPQAELASRRMALEPAWTKERADRVRLAAIEQARAAVRTRQRVTVALACGAALGLFVAGSRFLRGGFAGEPHQASVPSPAPAGGAEALALSAETQLVKADPAGPRGYTLVSGAARFRVVHDAERPFRVVAGDVVIEDLGTIFTVERVDPNRVRVRVDEGEVSVTWPQGRATLHASSEGVFPPPEVAPPAPTATASGSSAATGPSWKQLAQAGDFDGAYRALERSGMGTVRDDVGELLLAADAARLSGHSGQAVGFLNRIVNGHGGDARASLAAFTLGRMLLDELGRPREAAAAFMRARSGPLAEDALARAAEAYARAGDKANAQQAAEAYLQRYPKGRRAQAVRKFGGLP